ncbi:unnamed protein product [Mycena citricolor]|uniref:DUF323 domain-containing protein n=1 Tax=Mycena citricolor TaxID=2018698 RepID=A0AAD2GRA9_9AGAR|nr:unnamed protein product [Mycena citricolor]
MSIQITNILRDAGDDVTGNMAAQVRAGLLGSGPKHLPTMLLYDERGLRLYDDITTNAPEYYLFGAEEEILKNKSDDIVAAMHRGTGGVFDNEVVLELGAGALRKTSHVLLALARLVETTPDSDIPPITYFALDLEQRELERTLGEISASAVGKSLEGKVETRGLCATYDQGLKFAHSGGLWHTRGNRQHQSNSRRSFSLHDFRAVRDVSPPSSSGSGSSEAATSPPSTPDDTPPPVHLMFLGSSLGNFSRSEGAAFLRSLPLRPGSGDTLLIGLDHDNEKAMIEAAYNDSRGYTKQFILNGLKTAGRAIGDENLFDEDNWEYVNNYDMTDRRHEAFLQAKRSHTVMLPEEVCFSMGEKVKIEESFKFSDADAYTLFSESSLRVIQRWTDSTHRYSLWLLERPLFTFPLLSSLHACDSRGQLVPKKLYSTSPFGVPSPEEWQNLWAAWDFITRRMIPSSMLMQKPIDLRHICLFYLGHIPTFLDIHVSKLLQEPHTEPESFKLIFERGIDPDVDDPNMCHPHSAVPQNESEWPTMMQILRFQARVRARVLKIYEKIDSGALALTRKVGRVLFMTLEHEAMHAETLLYMLLQRAGSGTLPPSGFVTPPWESLAEQWDSEPAPHNSSIVLGPEMVVYGHDDLEDEDDAVAGDHEFGWDNEHPKRQTQVGQFRIEWRPVTNGQFYRFWTTTSEDVALPASWVEVDGEMRVRTLYGPIPMKIAKNWPVLTSYANLSKYAVVQGGRLPTEAELRLFNAKFSAGHGGGENVGFRNWHPVPATTGNGQRGSNGGVWEWTSTVFDRYGGFVPSKLYPGYSADFFDENHRVVLGGSYATIPRLAERKSVRNWYHHKYAYAWTAGRVVYDV